MSGVFVDGEEVVFEGEAPTSPSRIFDLLMSVLSEQGRAVTGFVVDGEDVLGAEQIPETFDRIDAKTLSHSKLTLQVVREFLAKIDSLGEELHSYSRNILTTGWSAVFQRMEEFIEKIKPFADLFDNLGPYAKTYSPLWQKKFEELAKEQAGSLEKILKHFESGNISDLSNEVASSFAPLFDRSRKFLRENAIPELEETSEKT